MPRQQDPNNMLSSRKIPRLIFVGLLLIAFAAIIAGWASEVEKNPECSTGNRCQNQSFAYFGVSVAATFAGVLLILNKL